MRRLPAVLALVVIALLVPAQALAAPDADPELSADQLVDILTSPDPAAGLEALSPELQADALSMVEADLAFTDELVRTTALSADEAKDLGLKPTKAPKGTTAAVASGCWSHYYYTNWDLYWATVANSWMQLNWCGRNGSITSYSITNVGGTGTGLNYVGNSRDTRNVGWEVRGVTTHRWEFWIGGVSKCMQIRGGATGLYSRSINCGM